MSTLKIHKFVVGQLVRFSPVKGRSSGPDTNYKVVRQLPAEHNDHQYRIKSVLDGHERVVKESQLG